MQDDISKDVPARERINVNEDYEVTDWAQSFKTTPEEIRKAVAAVGDRIADVRDHVGYYDRA
jgi:hypothetical protein